MRHANPTRGRFAFKRARLPNPADYFREQSLRLSGGGEWKSAVCPFHDDTRPSLRVRLDTGGFRCMGRLAVLTRTSRPRTSPLASRPTGRRLGRDR